MRRDSRCVIWSEYPNTLMVLLSLYTVYETPSLPCSYIAVHCSCTSVSYIIKIAFLLQICSCVGCSLPATSGHLNRGVQLP